MRSIRGVRGIRGVNLTGRRGSINRTTIIRRVARANRSGGR